MRLDTITRIERFITDSLISSTQIPLGVNVIRLAATQDEEGIARLARSITVRYLSSDVNVVSMMPLTQERVMTFEVTLAAQSYLTESGHDYVVQMCAGAYNTLTNKIPVNTGIQIFEPLHLYHEEFQGITDNSQYVYTQSWRCTSQEVDPQVAIDPCVQRGNCSYLFPEMTKSTIGPGDVVDGNTIYSPVLPMPDGVNFDKDYCGVVEKGLDLVFKHEETEVFLANWKDYKFVSTGTFDTSGEFLIVNIYDIATNTLFKTYFASNCDGRKVIQIGGNQPNAEAQWLGGLWRSPIGKVGNVNESAGPEPFQAVLAQKNGFGFIATPSATIYSDPSSSTAATAQVKYGVVYPWQVGTSLVVEDVTYVYIGNTTLGKAWIRQSDYKPIEYKPRIDCEEPEIECGIPEGAPNPENTCKIEKCE